MDWCRVALITTFILLFQCDLHLAAGCKNRKTVVQLRISGKTNINIKFPSDSDPVKFVPYPYNRGPINKDCYICNGPRCRQCTPSENQYPSSSSSNKKPSQRTNIIIDLRRQKSKPQNETKDTDSGKNPPSTDNNDPSGDTPKQDGTLVVVEDISSVTSVSSSAADVTNNDGQSAAASASTVNVTNKDVIEVYDENSPGDKSSGNIQNIYIEDNLQSVAESAAVSEAETGPQSISKPSSPNNATPESKPSSAEASSASISKAIVQAEDNGNIDESAESESAATATAENDSNDDDSAVSSAEAISAADVSNSDAPPPPPPPPPPSSTPPTPPYPPTTPSTPPSPPPSSAPSSPPSSTAVSKSIAITD